ncbi:MAG: hypothetical protein AAF196_12260 [Planctomycetota bacterium]
MKLLRKDLISLLTALAVFAPAAFGQDPDEEKEPDPEIEEKLDTFKEAISDKKMKRDSEAIALIDELLQKGPDYHPKDRQDIIKGFKNVFSRKARKPDQPELYIATVVALGELGGDDAARVLQQVYGLRLFKEEEWQSMRERILEQVGKCTSLRTVEFLLDETGNNDIDGIKRAAGRALRHFDEAEFKTRRDIFEELLTKYGEITAVARSSADPNNATVRKFKRTLSAVSDGWNTTLGAMSGQEFRTAEDWYEWFNDHKNKPKDWQ